MPRQRESAATPKVGIFWLVADNVIFDTSTIASAEEYAGRATHALGHIECWSRLQKDGLAPRDMEYEEPPRGRVVYDTKASQFTVYADRCILIKKQLVSRIMDELNLPRKSTSTSTDSHYRCSYCLRNAE